MTDWTEIENPQTGGTAWVPQSALGLYEAAGWAPVPPEQPEPAPPQPSPAPVPAASPGTSTPAPLPPGGSAETEE